MFRGGRPINHRPDYTGNLTDVSLARARLRGIAHRELSSKRSTNPLIKFIVPTILASLAGFVENTAATTQHEISATVTGERETKNNCDISRLPPVEGPWVCNGIGYFSRTEAAAAVLMERYISSFSPVPGKSVQVLAGAPGGNRIRVDFLVAGNLIEVHPIIEEKLKASLRRSTKWIQFAKSHNREEVQAAFDRCKEEFVKHYTSARAARIRQKFTMQDYPLIVVTSTRELYERVISKLSHHYPKFEVFEKAFNHIRDNQVHYDPTHTKVIKKLNKPSKVPVREGGGRPA